LAFHDDSFLFLPSVKASPNAPRLELFLSSPLSLLTKRRAPLPCPLPWVKESVLPLFSDSSFGSGNCAFRLFFLIGAVSDFYFVFHLKLLASSLASLTFPIRLQVSHVSLFRCSDVLGWFILRFPSWEADGIASVPRILFTTSPPFASYVGRTLCCFSSRDAEAAEDFLPFLFVPRPF